MSEKAELHERSVPIGRPITNLQAHVLDSGLKPARPGETGELYLAGAGLARGYLGQPGRTAERFLPCPFGGDGERMYRTGDLARWRDDSVLVFAGRSDDQVKLRGYRIELGEVEWAVASEPDVAQCAAVVRREGAQDERLVAYVVPEPWAQLSIDDLRQRVSLLLPDYMVPSTFMVLDALPLSPNGKVDRRSLPAPEVADSGVVPPRTEVETRVAEVVAAILNRPAVGMERSFLALGGHSLLAASAVAMLREDLDVAVPVAALLRSGSLAEFAEQLQRRGNTSAGQPGARLRPRGDTSAPVPLARQQESVWFLDTLAGGNRAYHFQCTVHFHGDLRVDLLERALNTVIARHETLRTTFHGRLDDVEQVVADEYRMELPVVDLSGMEAAAQEIELERLIQEDLAVRFDLTKLPLIRWRLIRRSATSHVLTHVEHHLIHDGWSLSVFWQEIEECYTAWANGREPALAELPVQYADYVAWQRELTDQERQPSLDFWIERLRDLPPPADLPFAGPRPARQTFRGIMKRIEVDQRLYADLRRFSRAEGISLFATMCAGYMALLHRYTGTEDLLVGSGFANRQPGTEPLIGMFVNAVVLRVATRSSISFRQLTGEVQNAVLDALTHQDALFPDVVAAVGPPRDQSRNPLIQTCFNFHDSAMPEFSWPGVTGQLIERSNGTAKFDLNIIGVPRAEQRAGSRGPKDTDTLAMLWEYNTDIFSDAAIAAMISDYQALLRAAIDHADRPIGGLPSQR
jgi:hypothetical protein